MTPPNARQPWLAGFNVLPMPLLTFALAGCASPTPWQKPPAAYAEPTRPGSRFESVESQIGAAQGVDVSVFRLLERNADGLKWRLLLADSPPRWHSDAGERESQPARSVWQRVENLLFKLMPASCY